MVWQWLNFSWTESIKKRACRAFLNRYLGKYLDQRLELEGMTIDLANGCCSVENVRLSADVRPHDVRRLGATLSLSEPVLCPCRP